MDENDLPVTENDSDIEGAAPREPIKSQLMLVVTILLLIFGGGIWKTISESGPVGIEEHVVAAEISDLEATQSVNGDAFSEVRVVADAAFVFDVKTQRVLFAKEADKALPLASLTKLMTAVVANEILADTETITITSDALWQDGGTGFSVGEKFTRETLSDLTLLSSSNDGAFALAVAAGNELRSGSGASTFVEAMNIKSAELNLTNTYFRNPTGLDVSANEAGAYGSARDMAFLMEYIVKKYPRLLKSTTEKTEVFRSQAGLVHSSSNTNQYVGDIPRMIGSKTGYTDLAGGNLVIAFDAAVDRPVVIVVLGSSRSMRFVDVETLASAAMRSVQ